MWGFINDIYLYAKDYLVDYVDVDYSLWVSWLLTPLVVTFVLPLMIVLFLHMTALVLYIYKLHRFTLRDSLQTGDNYDKVRKILASCWDAHGWIWHGYEVNGMENIPSTGPALVIYYHGALPVDIYYLLAKLICVRNRVMQTVADYFLFKSPGFGVIIECMKIIPGTISSCAGVLKEGNLLAIAPGGVYESQFSDDYSLMWKKRIGFAKVAIEAKAPIIPMFTENIREGFRALGIFRHLFLRLYARTKIPVTPVYGMFPVKLVTHIGEPIPYDPDITAEELQRKVAAAIEALVAKHQRRPGNILMSILERSAKFREYSKRRQQSARRADSPAAAAADCANRPHSPLHIE